MNTEHNEHEYTKCVVVIPVYKERPDEEELRAFTHNVGVLRHHPIVLVTHPGCSTALYEEKAREVEAAIQREDFDNCYFGSVKAYNALCLSPAFYERFSNYEYMLICQLDVWIFRDELHDWSQRGFDYVGAPLYYPYDEQHFTRVFRGIGNGGLCLRRIEHCLRMLKSNHRRVFLKPRALIYMYWNFACYNQAFTSSIFKRMSCLFIAIVKMFGIGNTLNHFVTHQVNEDLIFGSWANEAWGHSCNVPDEMTAASFSIELHPHWLTERNNGRLPFGCHAYRKWEYDTFWRERLAE